MVKNDPTYEGREDSFMDVDRMINEGLGGGQVTEHSGLIEEFPDITEESPPNNSEDSE